MEKVTKRWGIDVDEATDRELREFLGSDAGDGEAFSEFVVEAVRAQIFHLSVARTKAANLGRSPQEIESLVEEAVEWARSH